MPTLDLRPMDLASTDNNTVVSCVDLMTKGAQGVFVRIYYPSANSNPSGSMRWFPPDNSNQRENMPTPEGYTDGVTAMGSAFVPILGKWLMKRSWGKHRRVTCEMEWAQPLKGDSTTYPVIVMSNGYGGTRFMQAGIMAALVAKGFIVFSIEHGDGSCVWSYRSTGPVPWKKPTGSQLRNFRADYFTPLIDIRAKELLATCELVHKLNEGRLDKNDIHVGAGYDFVRYFTSRLQLDQLMVAGYSLGGPSVMHAILNDQNDHIKKALLLDCTMFWTTEEFCNSVVDCRKPILFINADIHHKCEVERRMALMNMDTERIKMITVKDTAHISFCEEGRMMPGWLGGPKLNNIECERLVGAATKEFFDKHQDFPSTRLQNEHSTTLLTPVSTKVEKSLKHDQTWKPY